MLILIAIGILMVVPLTMLNVRLFRVNFGYHWLMAALGAIAAWVLIFLSRPKVAQVIPLLRWQPQTLFPTSPDLLVDTISWVYAVALITLCVAVLFTSVARRPSLGWPSWAGVLLLTAFGLFAVLAGNPLTLIMSWAAIDLFEVLILFSWIRRSEVRVRFLIALSTRLLGIAFLIWAEIVTRAGGKVLSFEEIPASASIYLLLAAGLRLGVLPMQPPFIQDHPIRRGIGTPLRLVPVTAALVLLTRAAGGTISAEIAPFLLILTAISGVYSAVSWLSANSELSGRVFWIIGMGSLAVAAAVRMQPDASLTWGIACILSGGALFMYSFRSKGLVPFFFLATLALTAFPYTPTWAGLAVYGFNSSFGAPYFDAVINFVLILTHIGLVLGFIRHALRQVEIPQGLERWVWIFYPLGLVMMILMEYFLGWQIWAGWSQNSGNLWWVGGLILVTTVILWLILYRSAHFGRILLFSKGMVSQGSTLWSRILSLNWLYRFIWVIYHLLERLIIWFTVILEGDGGILWALVFLFLLFSITLQGGLFR